MKVLALSKKERPYVPAVLLENNTHPKFTIRSLTRREQLEISAMADMNISVSDLAGKDEKEVEEIILGQLANKSASEMAAFNLNGLNVTIATLEKGLLNWEGLKDETGDDVEFSHENFELLSEELMEDLAREISGRVSVEDEKKSDEGSQLSSGSETREAPENGTVSIVMKKWHGGI